MEWWNLWVPFVGTIFGIGANIFINFVQSKKQQKFQRELNDNQQLFQKEIAKKQIDADVILKSRLHWIDNTKSIASEFLIDSLKLVTVNTSLVENYSNVAIWKKLEYKNYTEIKNDKIDKKEKKRLLNLKKQ
ncbi:hypothetical protein [Enterococcus hirae]|uniref:hypothetical protein n=1 Tax=Enterococcus hirae TaxID=1354 RepID=UPI002116168B|nr:hypothetical protein [Enterococcus hirae]